jgi:aspartate-semialdehyde dehydrogenase
VKKPKYNVAIVGATGAVGEQMREVLDEREFPVGELRLLASERSAGQFLEFDGHQ